MPPPELPPADGDGSGGAAPTRPSPPGARRHVHWLFWVGIGLAPIAALLLVLGQGVGPLRAAAVLAVLAVVLVGLSVVLRDDAAMVKEDVEDQLRTEVDRLRADLEALRRGVELSVHRELERVHRELEVTRRDNVLHAESTRLARLTGELPGADEIYQTVEPIVEEYDSDRLAGRGTARTYGAATYGAATYGSTTYGSGRSEVRAIAGRAEPISPAVEPGEPDASASQESIRFEAATYGSARVESTVYEPVEYRSSAGYEDAEVSDEPPAPRRDDPQDDYRDRWASDPENEGWSSPRRGDHQDDDNRQGRSGRHGADRDDSGYADRDPHSDRGRYDDRSYDDRGAYDNWGAYDGRDGDEGRSDHHRQDEYDGRGRHSTTYGGNTYGGEGRHGGADHHESGDGYEGGRSRRSRRAAAESTSSPHEQGWSEWRDPDAEREERPTRRGRRAAPDDSGEFGVPRSLDADDWSPNRYHRSDPQVITGDLTGDVLDVPLPGPYTIGGQALTEPEFGSGNGFGSGSFPSQRQPWDLPVDPTASPDPWPAPVAETYQTGVGRSGADDPRRSEEPAGGGSSWAGTGRGGADSASFADFELPSLEHLPDVEPRSTSRSGGRHASVEDYAEADRFRAW